MSKPRAGFAQQAGLAVLQQLTEEPGDRLGSLW